MTVFQAAMRGSAKAIAVLIGALIVAPAKNAAAVPESVLEKVVTVLPLGGAVRNGVAPEGSGVVIAPGGLIATASHVLGKATRIEVRLSDGRILPAEIVGRDAASDIAAAHQMRRALGLPGGQLVANPIPVEDEIPAATLTPLIEQALTEAETQSITAKAVTPFLLSRIFELTGGASLTANIALVRNNARLGAQIAAHLCNKPA